MIYTYSPNWYKPQCLHLTGPSLYYASNYILYHYSLSSKSVTSELCFRSIAVKHHLNYKDIKINAINSTQHHLVVGINQAHLALVSKETLTVELMVPLHGFQSVQYIYLYKEKGTDVAILSDKDGHLVKYSLDQEQPPLPIDLKVKTSPVKAIYWLEPYHFLVFTRGTILLFNEDFSHLITHIQVSHQDSIYSVDHLQEKEQHFLVFLTKNKEKQTHALTTFRFKYKHEFPLENKKRVEEIGEDINRINVNLYYPKKMSDKLKNNTKACLSIKWLTPATLMLSGKMGEVVTIRLDQVQDVVNLRPYSMEEREQYISWPDSRHYKEIYTILEANDRLFMVSTDHNLTVWQKQPLQPKYLYSIKFLTSSVSFFFTAEHDPRTVFALLKDANLRSFAPLEKGSHQLAEYWKCSKKYKIKKAVAHPSSQGVMALGSDCNRLQIYDIYQDRLMKLFEIGEQILHVSFEKVKIQQQIEALFKLQFKESKVQYVSHFLKQVDPSIIVMVQTTKNIILISGLNRKEPRFRKCPREKRLERIHHNHFWDGRLLLTSQNKQQMVHVGVKEPGKISNYQIQIGYPQGRVLFKYDSKKRVIGIVNFKGNKFGLTNITLKQQGAIIGKTIDVTLPVQIDYFFISHLDWRAIAYCQKEDALILIHLDELDQGQITIVKSTAYAEMYRFTNKIETLCFYLKDNLIIATKDQSIKVVMYKELELFQVKLKENFQKESESQQEEEEEREVKEKKEEKREKQDKEEEKELIQKEKKEVNENQERVETRKEEFEAHELLLKTDEPIQ